MYEFICNLVGVSEDADYAELDEAIYNKYLTNYDTLEGIISDLINYVPPIKSELTGEYHRAFCKEEDGIMIALYKEEYNK